MNETRIPDHPIDKLFIDRWSPRAFDASPMPDADLLTILEAARWAPSAFNIQPWRFLYADRNADNWQTYLDLLVPFNQSWAKHASKLIFVLSDSVISSDGDSAEKPSNTNSFDAGAAWAQLALQATSLGYQAHAMAGINYDQIHQALEVPERYRVEIAVAIGKRADPTVLPQDLQSRETPSQRLPIREIAFAGSFPH